MNARTFTPDDDPGLGPCVVAIEVSSCTTTDGWCILIELGDESPEDLEMIEAWWAGDPGVNLPPWKPRGEYFEPCGPERAVGASIEPPR